MLVVESAELVNMQGTTILDQRVCISSWDHYQDEFDYWNHSSWKSQEESHSTDSQGHYFVSSVGEAVTLIQDVVKTMLSQGYVLGKGALERIGLTDKFCARVEVTKSVDQRYHISDTTRSAVSATGRTAVSAASAVVNNSYFSKGALWMSGALSKAAKANTSPIPDIWC
ncbi:hypothetical protein K7X08_006498 [Anisodus acutangulus]|uniref:Uncharacterized protein n=1 Tax=Anisodus acutangulus TaxID=402998 RepID=A0A9Q1RRH6_9SOLA|nr:hypothetical protein K7X08_006498 [Anisodus acutangulus]